MSVTVRNVSYKGWKNCCRISNGKIELIVTLDVGPRVIRFGFVGGQNFFKEYKSQLGQSGGKKWRIYGGHRLWHAPEHPVRTYFPDNFPVVMQRRGKVVRFIPPAETTNGVQKEIDVAILPGNRVELIHRLRNTGRRPVELAPWALSVMAPGGKAIVPLPERGSHPKDLLPGNLLTVWLYTDMSDRRWTWGRRYILLRQASAPPQKLGAFVPDGWAAYALRRQLFVKKFSAAPCAYADFGCNFETFTNDEMLELETLGSLTKIKPGAKVEHRETWLLFDNVPAPNKDRDVDFHILPKTK